jgi:flagellar motor switch protein FliM
MTASDISTAIPPEIAGQIDGNSFDTSDVEQALRNKKADLLQAISSLEEIIDSIVEIFDSKLQTFVHEKTAVSSSEISMFSEIVLTDSDTDEKVFIQVNGDNKNLIGCFIIHRDVVRYLIALTFGGASASAIEFSNNELNKLEIKLLKLFVDHMMSGYFECVDVNSSYGIPRPPTVADKSLLLKLAQDIELISLVFSFSFGVQTHTFELVVPLNIFDKDGSEISGKKQLEKERQEERLWSEQLYKRVEGVNVPLSIEISKNKMTLGKLALLKVGDRLDFNSDLNQVKVLDEAGSQAFLGSLKINKDNINLCVNGAFSDKGV